MIELKKELNAAINVALRAGRFIMDVYKRDFAVEYKTDNSPVTAADKGANLMIYDYLKKRFPYYAVLSEELPDEKERLDNEWCWIVDPLDGTRDFVKKNGEFSVNIALAHNHEVVLGVIYVPVTKELYFAVKNNGAYYKKGILKKRIFVSPRVGGLRILKSRSAASGRLNALIERNKESISGVTGVGSSIKGCLVASGKAEVYYRFGNTYEWDTAGMQCIVEEAGGIFRQMDDTKMVYNRENPLNDRGFYILNRIENKLCL